MLLSNDSSLLSNWGKRNAFSRNVMDILTDLDMDEAKQVKNKKGRVWNLEKRETNHIEIRTIGGTNYQQKVDQILCELDQFIEIFDRSIKNNGKDKEYKTILQKHMQIVNKAPKERKEKFLQLLK